MNNDTGIIVTARPRSEKTARQVAGAMVAEAENESDALGVASVDTKLIYKPETFSDYDAEWPR